jgi:phosphate uptake regulator
LLNALLADWKLVLAMGGAAIVALAMIAYALFRPAENPEDEERKRRLHLNQIGRIAEGQIVELVEHPPESKAARKGLFGASARPLADMRPRHLVSYSYSISGVTYQTAQDITGLESQIRLERVVAGQPASIKYDASNPSDSILVADDWSGLR